AFLTVGKLRECLFIPWPMYPADRVRSPKRSCIVRVGFPMRTAFQPIPTPRNHIGHLYCRTVLHFHGRDCLHECPCRISLTNFVTCPVRVYLFQERFI